MDEFIIEITFIFLGPCFWKYSLRRNRTFYLLLYMTGKLSFTSILPLLFINFLSYFLLYLCGYIAVKVSSYKVVSSNLPTTIFLVFVHVADIEVLDLRPGYCRIISLCYSTWFALITHLKKVPCFSKQRGKKLVLRCVARHPFTEYIAGVSQRRVLSRG
jgi:hypothetical protein